MISVKHIVLFTAITGNLLGAVMPVTVQAANSEKKVLYWSAPMDPNFRSDKPGKSPMGMDLVPVYATEDDGSDVSISPVIEEDLGVRTQIAMRKTLWRNINTVGYIDFNEAKVSHIHLRTTGWIENLTVKSEGDRVKKGERLFDLYSPELVNAQQELVTALSSGNKGLIRASKERLIALGISKNQIRTLVKNRKVKQRISVYASQDGVVSDFPVREGMYIKPSMKVMTLADLSTVWLEANVFERQLEWVKVGQKTEVQLSYIPGKIWQGKVKFIYPTLDPVTRTLKVRMQFDNPDELLKPNMYANVRIYAKPEKNVIAIPLEALIRTGHDERVIIALGDGKFKARHVKSGIESGNEVEILSGVNVGDKVVTSAQFLIDSEASVRASITRMTPVEKKLNNKNTPATSSSKAQVIKAKGVIKAIDSQAGKLTIHHEAIPELSWPSMTMDFNVMKNIKLDTFHSGEKVSFKLMKMGDDYMISALHQVGAMAMSADKIKAQGADQ